MNKLEPTYLRYVYDGLHKGSLNAENASALPQGFIGLFESEFPADVSSVERISVLKRLTLWALFKGAVSTHLASEVLEEDEEDTKTLIDTYSKWFNSPEPGKYILYHDRLRSYFLQKLSSHEIQSLNERLISYLDAALKDDNIDEAQEYALEHLATHMAVESQLDNNYDRLHEFVNQEDLWKRQIKVSKEYKWSQQAVQYGIKEGARRHHEMNTLTSTVNSVKLLQDEQNSSSDIFSILAEGDMDLIFQRLDSLDFKKQGKLYILMIHELTIGELKSSLFRKDACVSILKKLSSISDKIDMNFDFIEVRAIYAYHLELSKMEIDDKILWIKTLTKSTDIFEDCYGYMEVDLVSLLDYNIDLEVVEKLSLKLIKHNNYLSIILFKIIDKYLNMKATKDELKYQSKISYLLSLILHKIDLDFHQKNFRKVIDYLIVNNLKNGLDELINKYVRLSIENDNDYDESVLKYKDYNHDSFIKDGVVFYLRIGNHISALRLYKNIKTDSFKREIEVYVCEKLFRQSKQKELIAFLSEIKSHETRTKALLEICLVLIDEDRFIDAFDIILSDKNIFKDVLNLNIYDYLLDIKKNASIQDRFNIKQLYFKTFTILYDNRDDLVLYYELDFYWLLRETIYLNRCRNDKELLVNDLNDLLHEILKYKGDVEVDKAIDNILDEVDLNLLDINPSERKFKINFNYLFNLILLDFKKATECLNKLELDIMNFWASRNPPEIILHNAIWGKFDPKFDDLCQINSLVAKKIIEKKLYPKFNYLPGRSLETPLYIRLINSLFVKKEVDKGVGIYEKTKDVLPHVKFLAANSNNRYEYINSETGELFFSDFELVDQRYSVNDLYLIAKKITTQNNLDKAKIIFNDIKSLYPVFKEDSYRKIIFNGMIEFDEDVEKALFYLKRFMLDSTHHHFNDNKNIKYSSNQEPISSSKQYLNLLKSSKMKDLNYRFVSEAIKKNLLHHIFDIKNYADLYYTLAYNNQLHLVIEDIIDVNFESQIIDAYKFVKSNRINDNHIEEINRCLEDDLNEKNGVMHFNDIPFSGIVYELYPNKSLKYEMQYNKGLKDGFYKKYSSDGILDYSMDYKDNKIDLNCFSQKSALSYVMEKFLNSDNVEILALLEKNTLAKKLINKLEIEFQEKTSQSIISSEASQILIHLDLDKNNSNWRDYKSWEKLMSDIANYDSKKLKRLENEIQLESILQNKLGDYVINSSFEVKDNVSNITADKIDEYSKHVRSLVWLAEILSIFGYIDKSLEILHLALKNTEFFKEEDLLDLIKSAYLDPYFYSIKSLINGFLTLEKYVIAFDILKNITNIFSSYINFSEDPLRLHDTPQYGHGDYELYFIYHDIGVLLWKKNMHQQLFNLFDLISNKKWINSIKTSLLIKEDLNPLDENLINDIEVNNLDISNFLAIPEYKYICDFNLYVIYATKLIRNKKNSNAEIFLSKAKNIMKNHDNEFQKSIILYNSIFDLEDINDFYYKLNVTIRPDLEQFYKQRALVEGGQSVVEDLILSYKNETKMVAGLWPKKLKNNTTGKETNCDEIISEIFYNENKFSEAFRFAFKIPDKENRLEQFRKILDKLDVDQCIKLINQNKDVNYSLYFSKYLSQRINNYFDSDLEYTYLSNYCRNTKQLVDILKYKVFSTCYSNEAFDEKKIDCLSKVFDFDNHIEISREVMKNSINK